MCLLFLYINTDKNKGRYSLIVANNRDEYWERPTATMEMKGDKYRWIGGRDQEPGREGGTWLGFSDTGKLAVLLNILSKQHADKKGRGKLVTDFLESDKTGDEYAREVLQCSDQYNAFHLILVNLRSSPISFHYVSSLCSKITNSMPGIFSCDNSSDRTKPWRKTVYGEERFAQIVKEEEEEDVLLDQLINLLDDKTPHLPDGQLLQQFTDVGFETGTRMEQRSCINVNSPSIQYGTRTRTVLLVSHSGSCTYVEKTLDPQQQTWSTKCERFFVNLTG